MNQNCVIVLFTKFSFQLFEDIDFHEFFHDLKMIVDVLNHNDTTTTVWNLK